MNIWNILKSSSGKINRAGLLGTTVVVGVFGLSMYNYATDRPAVRQAKINSVANIINSGAQLPREYSGISLTTGSTQFATAEEIAQYEGHIFDGGEDAVTALNGRFAQGRVFSGGEAGLGMGANEAQFVGGQGGTNGAGEDSAAAKAAAAAAALAKAGQGGAGTNGNTLRRASITRAGGSEFGGGANGFGASARREGVNNTGVSSISGAMPGGSTFLALDDSTRGVRNAKYVSGYRDARAGYGTDSVEGKNLREIAVHSGKVAANKDRSSNEGAAPFLATRNLAGDLDVSTDSMFSEDPSLQGIGDDSYLNQMDVGLPAVDSKLAEVDTAKQEQEARAKKLNNAVGLLILASVGAMFAIAALKNAGPWGIVGAAAITALMAVLWAIQIGAEINYIKDYGGSSMTTGHLIIAALSLGGIGSAWYGGFANFLNKIASTWLGGLVSGAAKSALGGVFAEKVSSLFND